MSAIAQRRTAAAAAIMMLMTMLQFALLTVNPAPAGAAFGGATLFEIDGNTSGANDWDGNDAAYDIVKTDDGGCASQAAENQIVPGTKLDDPWVVNTGQVLGKGDLCSVWTGSELTAGGDAIFYFAWLREFNQGEVTVYVPLDGSPIGSRSGDVLIKFEFEDNTKDITVTTLSWTGSNWGNEQGLGAFVDAKISDDTKFGEAAVNLSASGILPTEGCNRLVGASMITETGQGDANPTLKDVVELTEPIVFNTCGAASLTVVKDVNVAGAPGIDFDFSVTGEDPFTLADGGSKTFDYELDPASATVALTVGEGASLPDYWSFVSISCTNGVSSDSPSADLTLSDGDDVTCTFTNTYTPPNPAIDIEKTPDTQAIVSGGTATFTITVTNTGDVDLTDVSVTDALSPDCARADLGSLAVGASTDYQCTLANVTADFTNSATATGTPPVGPDVSDTDTADVTVINPAIDIEKTPDTQAIVVGGTATFTITVTNTGDVDLTDVSVTDALSPDCDSVIGDLAAGASTDYQCTLANVETGFTNSATATGTPPVGPDVSDTDTADVTVNAPSISIVKDADQTIVSGGTATFTITVTNTGDVDLTDVSVTDALSPDCDSVIGDLAAGASTDYQCTLANVTADFTNTADVVGTPPVGPNVTDSDTADVDVTRRTTRTTQPTPTGSIGDYVWIDGDGDGMQDDFELPAAGVTVELLNANGALVETTTSDANGAYLFDDLEAGTYLVRFTVTDTATVDYRFTKANAADVTDDADSDVVAQPDMNVGLTGTIELAAGEDELTVDAGVVLFDVQGIQIEPTTTTTIEPVTVGTLPFTGFDVEDTVLLSMMVLAAGALLLFAASLRDEEQTKAPASASSWSNR